MPALLFILFLVLPVLSVRQPENCAREVLTKMLEASDKLETAKYTLKKKERFFDNLYVESEIIVKLQTDPFKVYVYSIKPNPGGEALYVTGENSNKVLVNPNRFPFFNLNLLPHNSILRENQHHSILEIGFSYINTVIKQILKVKGDDFYKLLSCEKDAEWKGKKYYRLYLQFNDFKFVPYTVKKGENLLSIANKLYISEYMTLEANPHVKDYYDVREGQVIHVPNYYSKKIEFYIDRITYLPLVQIIYDEKGLYEQYEVQSLIVNPVIRQEEFSPTWKEYKF